MIPRDSFLYRLSKNPKKTEKLHIIIMWLMILINLTIIFGVIMFIVIYLMRN